MEIEKTNKIEAKLFLNEDEIRWLKGVLQNSLTEDELQEDKDMRYRFWHTLNEIIL